MLSSEISNWFCMIISSTKSGQDFEKTLMKNCSMLGSFVQEASRDFQPPFLKTCLYVERSLSKGCLTWIIFTSGDLEQFSSSVSQSTILEGRCKKTFWTFQTTWELHILKSKLTFPVIFLHRPLVLGILFSLKNISHEVEPPFRTLQIKWLLSFN